MDKIRIGVIGASGYAGGELVRVLCRHPDVEITYLASDTQDGKPLSDAFPSLMGQELPFCENLDVEKAVQKSDLLFLARGHGWAAKNADELLASGKKVIDLSGDFRFKDPSIYEKWYKTEHLNKDACKDAVYGLSELHRDEVMNARLLANPGCYPTGSILALAPLVAKGLVDLSSIIVDAKSGVSGAGRSKTDVMYLYSELNENLRAYKLANHQHTPEIEQELSRLSGKEVVINFTPHLIPMIRGILTTAYVNLSTRLSTEEVLNSYLEFYENEPFVIILPEGELPATKNVAGSNYCHIGLKVDPRTNRVIVVSAIDNMGKGAASQAVQNMNLMCGYPETTGISYPPVYP